VPNRVFEDEVFDKVPGFRPYWFGGMKDDNPTWVSQQVPDGTDWLEYMIVGTPDGHGIPDSMTRASLGSLDHFALGVVNAEAVYSALWNNDRLKGQAGV